MKNDREFIDGIYEKARMLQEQEAHNNENDPIVEKNKSWFQKYFNTNRFGAGMAVIAMALVAIILIPRMLAEQGEPVTDKVEEYSIEPATYGLDNQRTLPAVTISGEGTLLDSYINNGEGYYLIELGELKTAYEVSRYVVLYDNGFNKDKLEKVKIGSIISFSYIEDPVSLIESVQDVLNKEFEQELVEKLIGDTIAVYPIDSIQIKE